MLEWQVKINNLTVLLKKFLSNQQAFSVEGSYHV